jgi:hypothetical protein
MDLSFNEYGLLPPGTYRLTLEELKESILVTGGFHKPHGWDAYWRYQLVEGLEVMVRQLWEVGYENIFIDGSFVEDKPHPNDIDGYFECPVIDFVKRGQDALNEIEPIWTWNWRERKPHPDSPHKPQLPMWHKYRVELYPHYTDIPSDLYGLFSNRTGIRDPEGKELPFPDAFRLQRVTYREKGIVQIIR